MAVQRSCFSPFVTVVIMGILMLTEKYVQAEKKLRMVNMVYRHGDRSPYATFPLDTNLKLWPQGLGQLTQKGMRQEHRLGEFIKNRYINKSNLLNSSYIRDQVYCRSTDVDRTIMSAQAQLNGLYPPYGRQVWRQGVKWQPIPVHVVSKKNDKLLYHWSNCPKFGELLEESYHYPEFQAMEHKYKDLVQRLDKLLGFNGTLEFKRLRHIDDNFQCALNHNFSLPDWANTTVIKTLKKIDDFLMYWSFHNKSLTTMGYGPLLEEMINHMKSYKAKEKDLKKIYLYSAHDTTLAGLLSLLDLFDRVLPPYSSAVLMELYSSDSPGDDFSVRLYYRVGQSDEPRRLVYKGCDADCPLDKFIELTKKLIPEDRDKACGVKVIPKKVYVKSVINKTDKGFLAAFVATLAVLIILVVIVLFCWCRYRRSQKRGATLTSTVES